MNKIIITIRDLEVIVDRDLAELCQIKTKVLNQAVKRYIEHFSKIDRFQLNDEEMWELVTTCDRFKNLKHSTNSPFVFTKNGAKVVVEILKKNLPIDNIFNPQQETSLILNNDDLRSKIYSIRGFQVMLDFDLADIYKVSTKRLNEQVKRNKERFPKRFRFQLNKSEFNELVANCDQFKTLKHSSNLPFVFTEQGIAMLATVLNSKIAITTSIKIIDAFVDNRKLIANNATVFQRLGNIEQKLIKNDIKNSETDEKINSLFNALDAGDLKPKQGIFYEGQVFDAYVFISDLIKEAKKSIILIDNYIDESVLTLFLKRRKNCVLVIYTKKLSKQLQLDLDKHNKQYDNVTVKIFESSHDRFLILDNSEIYHIGASLKDLGNKIFAFSKFNKNALELINNKIKE